MPTGTETSPLCWGPSTDHQGTCFRLWAPAQQNVTLRLGGQDYPMQKMADGWFESNRLAVLPGMLYGFLLDTGQFVPDPASRYQQNDLHGSSIFLGDDTFVWQTKNWKGRPWNEAVIYEIHIGTFTDDGTFRAAIPKLARLAALGFTVIEIMPIAHFPGTRGWGYDGVQQYAGHNAYGTPDDFKALIDAAHSYGLMVFLDVVYNHFGPEGNYLSLYAPDFFRSDKPTPWGAAIAYEREPVRRYFIENVLYWLRNFHLDGLRLDAVDQISDASAVHILQDIAQTVRDEISGRHVHLITENPDNGTDLMQPMGNGKVLYEADWNDDFHHAFHVAATGENTGYYDKFKIQAWQKVSQTLAEGYLFAGQPILMENPPPGSSLSPLCYVHFLQNHDQIGNRALGNRIASMIDDTSYRLWTALLLLSPQIPLMFMGDDYKDSGTFHFFADYEGETAQQIKDNRPREALNFGGFPDGCSAADIPDPNMIGTFERSKLHGDEAESEAGQTWSAFVSDLLAIRHKVIIPLLTQAQGSSGTAWPLSDGLIAVDWTWGAHKLSLRANFTDTAAMLPPVSGAVVYASAFVSEETMRSGQSISAKTLYVALETR